MTVSARRIWTLGRSAALAGACLLTAGLALAQDAGAPSNADDSGLNIPQDVKLLGKMDPNHRHATAKVNGQIITGTDVDQRVALVIAANDGAKITDAELLYTLTDARVQQSITAQHILIRPRQGTIKLFTPRRFHPQPQTADA